jgi:hypothetical protein
MRENNRKREKKPLSIPEYFGWVSIPIVLVLLLSGCKDPNSFSGHYQGSITSSEFLRRGFGAGVTVDLTLSVQNSRRATGTLTTSDGLFSKSPVAPLGAASVDILADTDFPGTNPIIMFLSAPMQTGEEATLLLTLGGESGDEMRIFYGRDGTTEAQYGIFPIKQISE